MARKPKGMGYIRKIKRKKGWYYQGVICLGYNPDGTKNTESKSSYNQQEVKDWLKEMNDKIFTAKTDMTLINYINKYLEEEKKGSVKTTTYEQYISRVSTYLKPYPIADMKMRDIAQENAKYYCKKLVDEATIPIHNYMLSFLKSVFKKLHEDGEIALNPFARITAIKYKRKFREPLTLKEQETILNSLDLSDKRELAIYIALNSGCRLGEVMGLKWEDISDDGIIRIDKQYARVEKGRFEETSLKTTNSKRENPIPHKAFERIEKYRGTGYIFSDDGEKPFDRKKVQRRFNKICKEHGIKSTFHSTRHTYITRLYEAGIDAKTAQILAGHADIETTLNIYTHVSADQKRKSVEALEDLME